MACQRQYDMDYKIQSVKLANEIGLTKAARELGLSPSTLNGWLKTSKKGSINLGFGAQTPSSAMSLTEELEMLRKQVKDQNKQMQRLKEENSFLEEASAFFAASRLKSAKKKD